jgi:hypothetical protein
VDRQLGGIERFGIVGVAVRARLLRANAIGDTRSRRAITMPAISFGSVACSRCADLPPSLASQKLIDRAILDDPSIYPDAAAMQRLYVITASDQQTTRLTNRLWTRVKTGK